MIIDNSQEFFASILDSMSQQIAVLDTGGTIRWVNLAWKEFALENGGPAEVDWATVNYLNVCRSSEGEGDPDALRVNEGITRVIRGDLPVFYHEYPCHSPTEQRWFMMRIRPLNWSGPPHLLVTHQNITERKLAEFRVEELAIIDGLTGIANRRRFDEFLDMEWRRARRHRYPVSLALIDLDYFKRFNDQYGHLAGDECLRRVGEALKSFSRRPEDLVARYGGEEFAVIFGNTPKEAAVTLAEEIRSAIAALDISHEFGCDIGCMTASVGVATFNPGYYRAAGYEELIAAADRALYAAKENGRNKVHGVDDALDTTRPEKQALKQV